MSATIRIVGGPHDGKTITIDDYEPRLSAPPVFFGVPVYGDPDDRYIYWSDLETMGQFDEDYWALKVATIESMMGKGKSE